MTDDRKENTDQGPPSQGAAAAGHEKPSGLPRPLQEHLAQQLRSTYQAGAEKPAFLGDPAIPAELEQHLQRLEAAEMGRRREKVHNQGVEAVKSALEDIVAGPLDVEPSPAEPPRQDETQGAFAAVEFPPIPPRDLPRKG